MYVIWYSWNIEVGGNTAIDSGGEEPTETIEASLIETAGGRPIKPAAGETIETIAKGPTETADKLIETQGNENTKYIFAWMDMMMMLWLICAIVLCWKFVV